MWSRYALVLLALAVSVPASAQTAPSPAPRTAYYVELGGNGGYYSLNAERRVGSRGVLRAGVSAVPLPAESPDGVLLGDGAVFGMTLPLTAGVILGDGPLAAELASGVLLTSVSGSGPSAVHGFLTATAGARWAPGDGPLLLRATFTPILDTRGEIWPMVGLSVGVRR